MNPVFSHGSELPDLRVPSDDDKLGLHVPCYDDVCLAPSHRRRLSNDLLTCGRLSLAVEVKLKAKANAHADLSNALGAQVSRVEPPLLYPLLP